MNTIQIEDVDAVRILTLNRPPANAIEEQLLSDLQDALHEAQSHSQVRALVVTGAGSFFSAGFDFRAPRRSEEQAAAFYRLYRDTHVSLLSFPKPTVAWVQGHAIAGGLVLALACDYRLGVQGNYRIGLNEIAVGAAYPRAALEIIRLRLSHARAAELMLGAALYPATEAIRLGVVDELLSPEGARDTVLRRAARLGAFPAEAYAHTKRALVGPAVQAILAETEDEARDTRAVWQSPEGRAARHRQCERLLSR
ncbi:MAG: enoyl-CoA hydratase/isomerase family protein [Candidatus Binatia bacterium]|nr:enoyl-CoA hydratase/isomerase family protein [Candidatus Binatia bacterium]